MSGHRFSLDGDAKFTPGYEKLLDGPIGLVVYRVLGVPPCPRPGEMLTEEEVAEQIYAQLDGEPCDAPCTVVWLRTALGEDAGALPVLRSQVTSAGIAPGSYIKRDQAGYFVEAVP